MQTQTFQEQCISHTLQHPSSDVEAVVNKLCERIQKEGDHLGVTAQEQMDLVRQMAQCAVGRYLLLHRGLNAWWSRYFKVLYPEKYRAWGVGPDGKPFTPWERWYLESPLAQASQENWRWCRQKLQEQVSDYTTLASVPCGAFDDLLELDDTNHRNVCLVGMDIDPDALCLAQDNIHVYGMSGQAQLKQADAWDLGVRNQWNVLTSKGLAGYEPDPKRLLQLYQEFYRALKPEGIFITNLWLPPAERLRPQVPFTSKQQHDLKLLDVLMRHVLQMKWNSLSQRGLQELLQQAGFVDMDFLPGTSGLCMLVTAKKPFARRGR